MELFDLIYDLVCVFYFRLNSCLFKVNRDWISVGFYFVVMMWYMVVVNIDGELFDLGFYFVFVLGLFGFVVNLFFVVSIRWRLGWFLCVCGYYLVIEFYFCVLKEIS